ncbi:MULTISPECIES: hypothetical protein [unclassified Ruegeria]|uniref:hypothetical protein n=1 Tax=unclassified Ruegeria TaxID=2625375 RepID=UPI001492BAB1|nr:MULTISPECIES: hypothetical protein [unclassified Ruegeria]NOE35988.1 hypothetical protein [Ruegeria sp. HKCCD7318]
MRAGANGQIAISWNQTELDELEAPPLAFLVVGAAWSWRGQAVFLSESIEQVVERSGSVGRAASSTKDRFAVIRDITGDMCGTVVLTNGAQRFSADLVVQEGDIDPTFVFTNGCPPRDQAFWVSEVNEFVASAFVQPEPDTTVVSFPRQALSRHC